MKYTLDNPPSLYSKVMYRGEECETASAPKLDGTIRVQGFIRDCYAPISEIQPVSHYQGEAINCPTCGGAQ